MEDAEAEVVNFCAEEGPIVVNGSYVPWKAIATTRFAVFQTSTKGGKIWLNRVLGNLADRLPAANVLVELSVAIDGHRGKKLRSGSTLLDGRVALGTDVTVRGITVHVTNIRWNARSRYGLLEGARGEGVGQPTNSKGGGQIQTNSNGVVLMLINSI